MTVEKVASLLSIAFGNEGSVRAEERALHLHAGQEASSGDQQSPLCSGEKLSFHLNLSLNVAYDSQVSTGGHFSLGILDIACR